MNRSERRRGSAPAPNSRRNLIISISIAAVIIGVFVAVGMASRVPKTASDAPVYAQLAVGQKAPEFSVSTTSGPFDLNASAGKPTLLELFATWCPHCQREVSVLNTLYDKYKGKANVVAVSASATGIDSASPESQAGVIGFAQKFGVRYPIAYDGDLQVAKKYLQGGFPTLIMIDKTGRVANISSGEVTAAVLDAQLKKASK